MLGNLPVSRRTSHQSVKAASMPRESDRKFFGYVKVEILSHYPRRWGWAVCKDAADIPLIRSDATFFSAEDAWNTGRSVLAALERGDPLTLQLHFC